MVRCAVVGAKGYTGCELVKLLARHPQVELSFIADKDEEPQDACDFIPNLPRNKQLVIKKFNYNEVVKTSDVIFLALPHTKSIDFVQKFKNDDKIVIDLSADFRLKNLSTYEKWYKVKHADASLVKNAVYGLPELYRDRIKKAKLIANPGCYPTAVILGLLPLLKKGLINTDFIICDAKTGISGAGRNPTAKNHFCEVYDNFQAYKLNQHQHMPEIEEIISDMVGEGVSINFVPHLLPILRGILITSYFDRKPGITADKIYSAFHEEYKGEPFIRVMKKGKFPQTKNVQETNYCDIGVWANDDSTRVIIVSVIDNLVKGASGQAIQNMNLCCGLPEEMGLV